MLLALLIAKAFAQGVSCQRIPEQLEMLLCRRHATPRTRRWYLSVPWSPSRVSTAPAYPIDEPVITAATTWDFSITSNILRLDYVVRHTNSSELDAAALRLYPNITGTLMYSSTNFTGDPAWASLKRSEQVNVSQVLQLTTDTPEGANVCVDPIVAYENAGSPSPRSYRSSSAKLCFTLPAPSVSTFENILYTLLVALACLIVLIVLALVAIRERGLARQEQAAAQKLPRPSKIFIEPSELIRPTPPALKAAMPRETLVGLDEEYLVIGETGAEREYVKPTSALVKLGDRLYAEIAQVLNAEEDDDEYCFINTAFRQHFGSTKAFYESAQIYMQDGTYVNMSKYFIYQDGRLRRRHRDEEQLYEGWFYHL
eukprot:m.114840 g.114840  ORF g.114840 m.114840 type:complete len:370 (+) comp15361_c0_seq47:8249-9358(+)